MSRDLVLKMIEALRDTAAKTDETVEHEEFDVEEQMRWPEMGTRRSRKVRTHKFERDWIAGRLLGMADMAEALMGPGPNLADANTKKDTP